MNKAWRIFLNTIPVLIMIGAIPVVADDYALTALCCLVIVVAFLIHRERREILIFILGIIIMFFAELLFVSTGAEVFSRKTLFGVMPLWLPFLWGYGFVAIKRAAAIL